MYQLCLGDETFSSLLDRISERVCTVTPGLEFGACRNLVDLVFRARVRKTEACGKYPECVPHESVWGDHLAPAGAASDWEDLNPLGLPVMFATAAADLAEIPSPERKAIEKRLARVFEGVLSDHLFGNPNCGKAAVCRAEPVFPFQALGRGRR